MDPCCLTNINPKKLKIIFNSKIGGILWEEDL